MSLTVLQQKVQTVATQLLANQLNVWNTASGGTMVMGSAVQTKDLIEQLSWGLISGLVSERNAFAAPGTPAMQKVMAQMLENTVRLDGKVGPLVITSGMLEKLNVSMQSIAAVVATQAAQGMIANFVGTGAKALQAAIKSGSYAGVVSVQPANVAEGKVPVGAKFPTLIDLEVATVPFGDRMSDIRAWVMSGAQFTYFRAYDVLTNPTELFKIDTVRIMEDGSGRRFIVTDQAGLGDDILGLTQGGLIVNAGALTMASGTVLGEENIKNVIQGEFSYDLAIKGYKLKGTATGVAGTRSFKATDVTTSANWEKIANAGTDNAPASFDGAVPDIVGGGQGGSTGVLTQQDAQSEIPVDVKNSAGVILTLTATVAAGA
ncbi:MAG: hypothetical protein [Bacteriophage sp.]|nr:MAG: hypothetical protein [Bacteriophage sp.]